MVEFKVHDKTSAPNESKPLLEHSEQVFGFVPNLHGKKPLKKKLGQ